MNADLSVEENLFKDTIKDLNSLKQEELRDFLEAGCTEAGYKGLSNAQSIYRKMLESRTYFLDEKKEAERLLENIKRVFGDELYGTIYSVLKKQHEERTADIASKKPAFLYHCSTTKFTPDSVVEPQENTCQFALHSKRMICASDSLDKNAIYSVREPYRSDGHKATSIITKPVEIAEGEKRKIVFQSELRDNGYIYKLPSENFIPVVRLDGYFDNEWISISDVGVEISEVIPITLKEIEEQYKLLCFVFPTVEKEEEFLDAVDKKPNLKKEFESNGYELVEKWVQEGIIERPDDKKWDKKLNTKPQYQTFYNGNKVFAVGMREELILDTGKQPEFIGTYGMGPSIGVAIISKDKEGKVNRVGLTHIDALTKLESLGGFVDQASKDADTVDVVMVSSENHREQAREILKQILINPKLAEKANVVAQLDGSTSFAVNTLTGSVYKDIPMQAFIQDHLLNPLVKKILKKPGAINKSPLYDPEKRKNAKSPLNTPPNIAKNGRNFLSY